VCVNSDNFLNPNKKLIDNRSHLDVNQSMQHVTKRIADIMDEMKECDDALEAMDGYYTPRKFEIQQKLYFLRDELRSLQNFVETHKDTMQNPIYGTK